MNFYGRDHRSFKGELKEPEELYISLLNITVNVIYCTGGFVLQTEGRTSVPCGVVGSLHPKTTLGSSNSCAGMHTLSRYLEAT